MEYIDWLFFEDKEEGTMTTLNARAMAFICKTLLKTFPAKIDMDFEDFSNSQKSHIPPQKITEALDTCLGLLKDEGLLRMAKKSKDTTPRYRKMVLTVDGFVFLTRVAQFQKHPKLFVMDVVSVATDDQAVQAFENFIFLMHRRNIESTWQPFQKNP